ncbi:hypothetical protein E1B28_009149 [Marasmius oreades]|uniref:Uncharacterized protein n=1 Tax=Marasmius oreades TaxID=181124 RepID=A0A9P7RZW6_9AGAR|nr:uncharacterized protein E1B28_009149 [Marasmius oreades]KAG7092834.1 hypothetical protein E1B28_009149 [Marasmius oreades]
MQTWGQSRNAVAEFRSATSTESGNTPSFKNIHNDDGMLAWNSTLSMISCLMNAVADSMLIHRCYVIWNSNVFVLYPLIFATVILNGFDLGCILAGTVGLTQSTPGQADSRLLSRVLTANNAVIIVISLFQIVLTFMTGGRIWWIGRKARQLLGRPTPNSTDFATIVAIVVESGLLYASTLLVFFIIERVLNPGLRGEISLNFGIVVTLMSGIAPTLIIVRAAYGKSVDTVHQMSTMLHFADAIPEPNNSAGLRIDGLPVIIDLENR